MPNRISWAEASAIFICAAMFLTPAILNGFPFIFPDSGDYMTLHPLVHRSPYYGLFFAITSFRHFLWPPIIAQCLIVSHLLWLMYNRITYRRSIWIFGTMCMAMTLLTSLPFFTDFVMADIFTGIMFLCMYLLAFHFQSFSKIELLYLLTLNTLATAAHIGNLSLGIGLLIVFVCLFALNNLKFKPLLILSITMASAALALLLFSGFIFKIWSISPAGQTFFMANMIEYGPVKIFLKETCPVHNYNICNYGELPETADEFLWTDPFYQKLGGFIGMRKESKEIVSATLSTHPDLVIGMVVKNFTAGMLTHAPAAEFHKEYQVQEFIDLLQKKYDGEIISQYLGSAEMNDHIPFNLLKKIDSFVFPTCLLLLIFSIVVLSTQSIFEATLPIVVIAFFIGNTLQCTVLSGVHDRYQARITWLLPLVVFLLLLKTFRKEGKKFYREKACKDFAADKVLSADKVFFVDPVLYRTEQSFSPILFEIL